MRKGLDSAFPPSAAQAAAAKAAGYDAWLGYFAGPDILNGWSQANFDTVKAAGLLTAAYCSGWADPSAMKAQSSSWLVPIILDDESGIRALNAPVSANRSQARAMMHNRGARPVLETRDGKLMVSAWVQPWLDASGSGLYGNQPVFAGTHASRYVFAAYPGVDPGASWPSYFPRPDSNPCAWQWQGTHSEFGVGVDSTYFDDGFWTFGPKPGQLGESDMPNLLGRASDKAIFIVGDLGKRHILLGEWQGYQAAGAQLPPFLSDVTIGQIPDAQPSFVLSAADEALLQQAHDQIAQILAGGTLTAAEQQQLQEAHDTILGLAKTGTLTPTQDANLTAAKATLDRIEAGLKGA